QLFLGVWLWVTLNAEQHPQRLWLLPIVQLVWINCHALFILGLAVGGCLAVDVVLRQFAQGRFRLQPPASISGVQLARVGGLCLLAAFCNPYFEEGALFPLVLYRKFSVEQEIYAARIGEFQQPF